MITRAIDQLDIDSVIEGTNLEVLLVSVFMLFSEKNAKIVSGWIPELRNTAWGEDLWTIRQDPGNYTRSEMENEIFSAHEWR